MQILLKLLLLAVIAIIITLLIVIPARQFTPDPDFVPQNNGLDLSSVLGEGDDISGFARAIEPREFDFPRDHGPHPDFRSEWWYFTGNLDGADGRRFGFQWVIFRNALQPDAVERTSAWGTNQAYMAHFAVTDVTAGEFHYFERFARGGAGLAGAKTEPLHVWLEDWSLQRDDVSDHWTLRANEADIGFELEMIPLKPVVLNGNDGLSRKSAGEGNASYYYAITRFDTRGILRIGNTAHDVSGLAWLDREWSTSVLADDQQGWDWFALHLDDGSDLMVYQLRRKDGSIDPFSSGTLTSADGHARILSAGDFTLEVKDVWRSPRGARYPSRWRLTLPADAIELEVSPVLADQELIVSIPYWEGAVDVHGSRGGRDLGGRGYVELVGY